MDDKKRVLIVDDEENVLFTLSEALAWLGNDLQILTAHNGQEALVHLRTVEVGLMFTDLMMPGMDGLALTEVARALYPQMRVVWITAHEPRIQDAIRLAVHGYLSKPLDLMEIRRITSDELGIPYPPSSRRMGRPACET